MNLPTLYGILIGLNAAVNVPSFIHLLTQRKKTMALNFAPIQAATAALDTNATALTAQAAASDDASNQAVLDAVTQTIASANTELAALLVPPATPPE